MLRDVWVVLTRFEFSLGSRSGGDPRPYCSVGDSNAPLRRRERAVAPFLQARRLQTFVGIHASDHSYFKLDLSLGPELLPILSRRRLSGAKMWLPETTPGPLI